MENELNVLILGHSITRNLRSWAVQKRLFNLTLNEKHLKVYMHDVSGATICWKNKQNLKPIWDDIYLISQLETNIIFLDTGRNDLTHFSVTPSELATNILKFAEKCTAEGAHILILSEILPRQWFPYFNEKMCRTNTLLFQKARNYPKIYFWRHNRNNFKSNFLSEFVAFDSFHIENSRGMHHYFRPVRGAIIFAEQFVHSGSAFA